jgi:FkbM family methyltransferase
MLGGSRIWSALELVVERPAALRAMVMWPVFSVTSYRLLDGLRRQGVLPKSVIDVGANVGQFAVAALRLLRPSRLHAFEPLPDALSALQRHLAAQPGVTIHPVALGASPGESPLHVNAHSHSSSLLPLAEAHRTAFPSAREVGQVGVRVRTLDQELSSADLPTPILLKLDAQGYERWVLDGAPATLGRTQWVILELSFRPMYEGEPGFLEMVTYMGARGFRLVRPIGWLADPGTGEILQCDALFARAAEDAEAL